MRISPRGSSTVAWILTPLVAGSWLTLTGLAKAQEAPAPERPPAAAAPRAAAPAQPPPGAAVPAGEPGASPEERLRLLEARVAAQQARIEAQDQRLEAQAAADAGQAGAAGDTNAEEYREKLRLYGFTDMGVQRMWLGQGSTLHVLGVSRETTVACSEIECDPGQLNWRVLR